MGPTRTPYASVIRTTARNKLGKWPGRGEENRLEPFAQPHVAGAFKLTPGAKVFTIGSCFARNIEEYLGEHGFRVPVLDYRGPPEEKEGGRDQGILNKYTPASIVQEFEWVLTVQESGGTVGWEHIAHLACDLGDDRFLDLQLASSAAVTRDRLLERRQAIYDVHVQALNSDLVVITPGVTECWFDTQTGFYIQQIPSARTVKAYPDRFQFEQLDYDLCRSMLARAVEIIAGAGVRNVMMTVSPVPLGRTMTDQDVIIANSYSKAILRAAVGSISAQYPIVTYFPSYETVMLTKDQKIWRDDLRHVDDSFVGLIVSRLISAYTDITAEPPASRFNLAFKQDDIGSCRKIYEEMGEAALSVEILSFHQNAFKFLSKAGEHERAAAHARKCREQRPTKPMGYVMEARAMRLAGDKEAAESIIALGLRHVAKKAPLLKFQRVRQKAPRRTA